MGWQFSSNEGVIYWKIKGRGSQNTGGDGVLGWKGMGVRTTKLLTSRMAMDGKRGQGAWGRGGGQATGGAQKMQTEGRGMNPSAYQGQQQTNG
eukprot:747476-Hanusia_phi.AAC.4